MFENLCTLPLSSDLFAQAIHPTEPIVAVGLAAGHVQSFRLPLIPFSSDDEDGAGSVVSSGTQTIETDWRTRRHKGSCRAMAYSHDGQILYSAGSDGVLKAANSSTGQATSKIFLPPVGNSQTIDPATLLYAPSPQTILVATDSAALHLYDLRAPSLLSEKPANTFRPHDDYISSLTPLPPSEASTSGFSKQWITTGGTTLALTDLRKGVLVKSENQEEELLSSVFISGLPARAGRTKGEKMLVGSSNGVITLWEKGVWDDQDERIIVSGGRGGGESLDCMCVVPEDVGPGGKSVAVGLGDGSVRIVRIGSNKVDDEIFRHDEVEGVVGLGFDVGGRMISGGGQTLKVWQERIDVDVGDDDEDDDSEKGDEDGEGKDDEDDDDDDSDSEEEERKERPKKKRKGGDSIYGSHGVVGFAGMD